VLTYAMNTTVHSPIGGSSPSNGSPDLTFNQPKQQIFQRNNMKVGAAANRRLVNKSLNGNVN